MRTDTRAGAARLRARFRRAAAQSRMRGPAPDSTGPSWLTIAERISRTGRMRSAHTPATTRSERRRLGERLRERLRIRTWCLRSTDSATTDRAAGTSQPGDRRQQMQKQDGEITHRTIGSRSRLRQKRSRILQFATHTLPFTRLADPDASGCDVALERVDGELLLIDDRPDDVADRDDPHQPTLL
jgi:hypothetical protein